MIDKKIAVLFAAGIGLAGCSDVTIEEPKPYVTEQSERIRQESGTIHGNPKGFVLYRTGDGSEKTEKGTVIARIEGNGAQVEGNGQGSADQTDSAAVGTGGAVNGYLWQASLESLDFMPLAQADSRGGVIITDWYAPSETPDERFKINVYIFDSALRADALKVAVFRQVDDGRGWVDAPVVEGTARGLEDNILTRARELRLATTGDASAS